MLPVYRAAFDGGWAVTTSARRTGATADLLAPLATRPYLEHGMAATTGERYVETDAP